MKNKILTAFACVIALSQSVLAAQNDPLVGTWKTIDDRTGYSLADVVIKKDEKTQQYSATIINTRSVPGAIPTERCTQCTGKTKNQPLVGLETLSGLVAVPGKNNEFRHGQWLDPNNGQYYDARARLMSNGKHLVIHSSAAQSSVGRNFTWVKN